MSLKVLLDGTAVGRLWLDRHQRLQFEYVDAWRQCGFALAPSVPLSLPADNQLEWNDATIAFFQNLLPEGQSLEDASRLLQLSKTSTFGLLRAMGQEASGAISVLELGRTPETDRLRPISRSELSTRIRQRGDVPFSVWDGMARPCISGYQDKLAVFEADGGWALVDGPGRASTHILKPDPVASWLAGLTTNEFFCMRLAAAVGLSVAPVRLEHVPEPVLVVERFDRVVQGEGVRRLHVIDACQALGVSPTFKYERPYGDGRDVAAVRTGVSLSRLFGLGRLAAVPTAFKLQLLRWVIFQALIQNFDAHAKNISFFWGQRGLEVAPAYDLVSIGIYPADWFPQTFAMGFGDAFAPKDLIPYEWAYTASSCGIGPRRLANEIKKLATLIQEKAPKIAECVIAEGADAKLIGLILDLVLQVSAFQRESAPMIPKIDPRLFTDP